MATAVPFSPEFLAQLDSNERFVAEGVKAVSQFARFPGPDGKYYAQLAKIVGQIDRKGGHLVITASFIILAYHENNSQEHGNHTVKIRFGLKDTEKQTKQEAFNRLYTDLYQALGCVTAAWPSRGPIREVMAAETTRLNQEHPAVILSIRVNDSDPRFHNANIVEHITHQAISHFAKPDLQVAAAEADKPDLIEDDVVVDFRPQYEKVLAAIANLSIEQCIQQSAAAKMDINPAWLASLATNEVRKVILSKYVQQAGHNPAEFDLPLGPFLTESETFIPATTSPLSHPSQSTSTPTPLPEDDDEPLVYDQTALKTAQVTEFLSTKNREQLKQMIFTRDATTRFSKSQTDDDLRAILLPILITDDPIPF